MRVVRLTAGDGVLLDAAVRRFRGLEGVAHRPFLDDPATGCALIGRALTGLAVR
ncbi:hypothetical protein [Saccharothrix deserti]|uniref:hypothetical protein n=1 Tax=Saccharothrix deserti TaxID=2593674 RepID=UPI00131E3161|nr:hypothetical protein [Saccharothrix deserti]